MEMLVTILIVAFLIGGAAYLDRHRPKSNAPPEDPNDQPRYTDAPK